MAKIEKKKDKGNLSVARSQPADTQDSRFFYCRGILDHLIGKYVIVRTYSAGVFAGILKNKEGQEILLDDARRIWFWDDATSLSQLAQSGTSKPDRCKFPEAVEQVLLLQAIEILRVSPTAEKSIREVPIWKQ